MQETSIQRLNRQHAQIFRLCEATGRHDWAARAIQFLERGLSPEQATAELAKTPATSQPRVQPTRPGPADFTPESVARQAAEAVGRARRIGGRFESLEAQVFASRRGGEDEPMVVQHLTPRPGPFVRPAAVSLTSWPTFF